MNNAHIHYNGLVNQGATCYLNSVVQVLYMTKGFREAVERHTCENPQCVECDLKPLFKDLKTKTACPSTITEKLGITRVYEQQDAAEYFENMLNLTSPGTAQVFHGELTHKITCSHGHTEKSSDEQFWHLPLALMDSSSNQYNVENGIEELFRASDFRGEDQMYCEGCDDKADATATCEVKQHPDALMLLLKRFHFDYNHMTYVKNNQAVCVPCTLEIPQNQKYDLYAVVDHFGGLRGGHYTATIKSQDDDENRWYNFNDKTVTVKYTTDAADTGTETIREVSTNGALLPDVSDKCDLSKDAENLMKTEEDEVEKDTAEAHPHDRVEEGRVGDLTNPSLHPQRSEDCAVDGDRKGNMSKDDQACEQGNSSLELKPEQQTKEKRDVNRDEEQKRKDEQAERKGSSTTNSYHSEGLEDQQRSEQKVSDTCTDVHVEKQDKDQENQGDNEQSQNRGESSFVQAESESGRLTEEHKAEKKRQKAKKIHVKIIEEEFTTTSGGIQKITEIENKRIETGDKTKDIKETLSEKVCNLKLNEPEKNRNKRGNEDEIEMNSTLPSNAKKLKL
ncbi:ubiquitin carboxyl-terminal hydrolase 13-like isoform X2 [Mastacembelus armatus]|uniref:ubiquitin carboxyl-terminal hydrolase 13-like isoform X2 n=1 Tax=Mastacembelus armatus TaxID=205130 RepID=UPI000E45F70C|nr:ubiquitin carboxyl-terminal hydrolase 13-like isoform X2 [Mastacembelus armatus]